MAGLNTLYLPKNVQAAIAANPDLYKRSITPASDRSTGVSIDLGGWSGEGAYTGPTPNGIWGIQGGYGTTPIASNAWNGQRLVDMAQGKVQGFQGYVPIDTSDQWDFDNRKNWLPGAMEAILGSAKWDDKAGLLVDYGVVDKYGIPDKPTFMDKLVPGLILGAVGMGIGQMAGLGTGVAGGGAGGAAGGGGAGGLAVEGAGGLASLPTAGTWAHTAAPVMGAGAGQWTLPAALSGIEGATAAGGLTLGEGLTNAFNHIPIPQEGLTTLTPEGGFDAPSNVWEDGWQPTNTVRDKTFFERLMNPTNPTSGSSSGGKPNMLKQLSGVKSLGDLWEVIKNNPDEVLGIGSGIAGLWNNSRTSDKLEDLSKDLLAQSDPFGNQRGQYQKMLSESYSNPMSIYNSPEYQGLSDLYRKKLEAKDAAAGRRSQYAGREMEMNSNFLNYLNDYRKELASLAGAGIAPNTATGAAAATSGIQASNNQIGDIAGILSYLFKGNRIDRGNSNSGSSNQGYDV